MDMVKFIHNLRRRNTMTNGERIKYLREKNGLTQKDVATSYYKIEHIDSIKQISTDNAQYHKSAN